MGDLGSVPYSYAGVGGCNPGAKTCFVGARAASEAAALTFQKLDRGMECEG